MNSSTDRLVGNNVERVRWMGGKRGKSHAFLVPAGDLAPGKVRAVCPLSTDSETLLDRTDDRCKTCVKKTAEDPRKVGTGLSEPVLPVVNKGATEAPTIGARDGNAHMDGPALVKGPNMRGVRPTWRNPVTGEIEPAAAYLGGSLRERLDREVAPREKPRRTKAQQRKFRARQTHERQRAARLSGAKQS